MFDQIKEEVREFYANSTDRCMREWFFDNHVMVVAEYADEIASKVDADGELAMLGALFHDVARAWDVWDEPDLMDESLAKAESIMKRYHYSQDQIELVKQITSRHNCREVMPETEEGKVLATADALAHLMTDFFLALPYFGSVRAASNLSDYKEWVRKKAERDLSDKIFYQEYKDIASDRVKVILDFFSE